MAAEVRRLDIKVGDVVEIGWRRYDVVPDKAAGVALESAITKTVEELRAAHGGRSLSREEFDALFADLPRDGRGVDPLTASGSGGARSLAATSS